VSYSEYPRIVRNAITVAGVTRNWNTEYTPTATITSLTMAVSAATAMRHSNRSEMNTATTTRKITRARAAFSVISAPQVELVNEKLMSSTVTPAASAKSAVTASACSRGNTSTCTVTTSDVSELRSWIRAPLVETSLADSTSVASSTPKVSLAGMSQASPPSKSSPRFRPWVSNDPNVTTTATIARIEADSALAVEVDRRLAPEQPAESGARDARVEGHAVATFMPSTVSRLAISLLRASSSTAGRVKK
jgi:hypothetical protein